MKITNCEYCGSILNKDGICTSLNCPINEHVDIDYIEGTTQEHINMFEKARARKIAEIKAKHGLR